MVSNEHGASRSYTEDLILKDFMKQTYSVVFKAFHNITYNQCPTLFTSFAYNSEFFAQQEVRKADMHIILLRQKKIIFFLLITSAKQHIFLNVLCISK